MYCTTAELSSKKRKKSSFSEEKSLVGLTPGKNHLNLKRNGFKDLFKGHFMNTVIILVLFGKKSYEKGSSMNDVTHNNF